MYRLTPILIIILLLFMPTISHAQIQDPRDHDNNLFGIHITDSHDLKAAAELVNSNGGEWGYVTFVIRQDQMDKDRWQSMFDQMRELKLIPLVRVATKIEGSAWKTPSKNGAQKWAKFLNSLNWVTKNRYVILFNEPNHSKEWGNTLNPEEFSRLSRAYAEALKKESQDFFILPGAMDAAAPNSRFTMSSEQYFTRMHQEDPEIFSIFDGWNSHAYPNPGFRGSPYHSGKQSIRGWEWELNFLQRYGLDPNIPVFITETGWKHNHGLSRSPYPSPLQVAENLEISFTQIWTDNRIVAITPFILDYPESLFSQFSWRSIDQSDWLDHFYSIQRLPKVAGKPVQIYDAANHSQFLPATLLSHSEYMIALRFQNTGQSIWNTNQVRLSLETEFPEDHLWVSMVPETKPTGHSSIWIRIQTNNSEGDHQMRLRLVNDEGHFGEEVIFPFSVTNKNNPLARFRLWMDRILHPDTFISATN